MHVSLHQIGDDIDVFEASLGGWPGYFEKVNDVLVVEELQKLDLSDDTLGVDQVFESLGDLLDGDLDLAFVVIGAANDTVGTVSDLFDIFKFLFDTEGSSSADEFLGSLVKRLLLNWSLNLLLDLLLVGGSLVFDGLSVSLLLLLLCLLTLPLSSVLLATSLATLLI